MTKRTYPIGYSLTGKDMESYLGKFSKIIKYSELKDVKNIETYMKDFIWLVILYEQKENYGHWTVLIKNDLNNSFEFFDSYGTKPDLQLLDTPMIIRNSLDQNFPYLAVLLFESKRTIFYNHNKLQKLNLKVATCGKWVIVRCLMYLIDLDLFMNYIKRWNNKKSYDDNLQDIWIKFITKNNYLG